VHADICWPTRTPSLSNKRYFLLFVGDYTRMMWIYFLDQKSEAFTFFLQFKALVERQSGYQMKTLRTDRSGEFIYKPFLQYYKENGIQRQLTVRRTPQ
jgi:transposase InsO family protein